MKQDEKITSIFVQDFNHHTIDLMERYQGKKVMIVIYNNLCLGCTGRAIPLAYDLMKEFDDLEVVGIHSNFGTISTTEEDIKSVFTLKELPFPIYLDEDASVFKQFESEGTPQFLIINRAGKLYRSIFGSQENAQNRLSYALASLD